MEAWQAEGWGEVRAGAAHEEPEPESTGRDKAAV